MGSEMCIRDSTSVALVSRGDTDVTSAIVISARLVHAHMATVDDHDMLSLSHMPSSEIPENCTADSVYAQNLQFELCCT